MLWKERLKCEILFQKKGRNLKGLSSGVFLVGIHLSPQRTLEVQGPCHTENSGLLEMTRTTLLHHQGISQRSQASPFPAASRRITHEIDLSDSVEILPGTVKGMRERKRIGPASRTHEAGYRVSEVCSSIEICCFLGWPLLMWEGSMTG